VPQVAARRQEARSLINDLRDKGQSNSECDCTLSKTEHHNPISKIRIFVSNKNSFFIVFAPKKYNLQFFNGLIDYDYDYNIYLNQFLRNKPFTFNGKIYN